MLARAKNVIRGIDKTKPVIALLFSVVCTHRIKLEIVHVSAWNCKMYFKYILTGHFIR